MKRVCENAMASNIFACLEYASNTTISVALAPAPLLAIPQSTPLTCLSDPGFNDNLLASVTYHNAPSSQRLWCSSVAAWSAMLVAYYDAVTIHCMTSSLLGKGKCRMCAVPVSA